jgi:Putative MetA-pathway of phenol degradation
MNHTPKNLFRALCLSLTLLGAVVTVHAQALIPLSDRLPFPAKTTQQSSNRGEEYIKPSRPGVANPAGIQKSGVLQVEYGYDATFRAESFRTQQTTPLVIRFATSSRLLLALNLDVITSETDEKGERETGVGDTRLGFQVVALKGNQSRPALAFAYYVKLPSASEEKGLGTGRIDHKVLLLLSKKFGKADMDINVAYLNVGREDSDRRASGGQGAISFSYEFENNLGIEGELSGQSLDDGQPRGIFALGALTYKVSKRIRFDGGVRFGLNPEAPRVGVFAGVTVGVANLFRE